MEYNKTQEEKIVTPEFEREEEYKLPVNRLRGRVNQANQYMIAEIKRLSDKVELIKKENDKKGAAELAGINSCIEEIKHIYCIINAVEETEFNDLVKKL